MVDAYLRVAMVLLEEAAARDNIAAKKTLTKQAMDYAGWAMDEMAKLG